MSLINFSVTLYIKPKTKIAFKLRRAGKFSFRVDGTVADRNLSDSKNSKHNEKINGRRKENS